MLPPHDPVDHDQEHDQQRDYEGCGVHSPPSCSGLTRYPGTGRPRAGRRGQKDIAPCPRSSQKPRTPGPAWTLIAGDVYGRRAPQTALECRGLRKFRRGCLETPQFPDRRCPGRLGHWVLCRESATTRVVGRSWIWPPRRRGRETSGRPANWERAGAIGLPGATAARGRIWADSAPIRRRRPLADAM